MCTNIAFGDQRRVRGYQIDVRVGWIGFENVSRRDRGKHAVDGSRIDKSNDNVGACVQRNRVSECGEMRDGDASGCAHIGCTLKIHVELDISFDAHDQIERIDFQLFEIELEVQIRISEAADRFECLEVAGEADDVGVDIVIVDFSYRAGLGFEVDSAVEPAYLDSVDGYIADGRDKVDVVARSIAKGGHVLGFDRAVGDDVDAAVVGCD